MKARIYTLLAALLLTVASAQSQTATTISVEDIAPITAGDDAFVSVTLEPEITTVAMLTVSNSDHSYNQSFHVAIVEGYGSCVIPNMAEGTYSCTASYAGNDKYAASTSVAKTLKVYKISTALTVKLEEETIYVGDFTQFRVELGNANAIVDGKPVRIPINTFVTISINGENRIENRTYGLNFGASTLALVKENAGPGYTFDREAASYGDIPDLLYNFPAGTYTLQATYAGDDKYEGCTSNVVTLTVNKIGTSISVSDISPITAGDDAVITVTMTPTDENVAPINAIATVTVGSDTYNVAIVNGSGSCVVPNLAAGTYDVTASYATDDKYIGSTSTTRQLVVNESGAGAASPLPKNAVATVTMTPASMNTIVELTVGGNTYHVPVVNGTGTYILPQMENGFYDVQATYAGDLWYAESQSAVQSLMSMADVALANSADNSSTLTALNACPARVTLSDRTLYKDGDWNTLCLPFAVDLTADGCPLAGAEARELTTASIEGTTLNLTFGDAVTTLTAGKPYIIRWTGISEEDYKANPSAYDLTEANLVFSGVTIDKTDRSYDTKTAQPAVETDLRVRFLGTYQPIVWNEENRSILFLGTQNTLFYPQPDLTASPAKYPSISAQRAYFKIGEDEAPQLARMLTAFNIGFGGGEAETNGIVEAEANSQFSPLHSQPSQFSPLHSQPSAWYTLDGRRLDHAGTATVPARLPKGFYIHNGSKVVVK